MTYFQKKTLKIFSHLIKLLCNHQEVDLQMKKISRYTLRIPLFMQQKIKHMALHNERSQNKEIQMAIKRYIADFERLHGLIEVEDSE